MIPYYQLLKTYKDMIDNYRMKYQLGINCIGDDVKRDKFTINYANQEFIRFSYNGITFTTTWNEYDQIVRFN